MLHFYQSIRIFKTIPEEHEQLDFECKICNETFKSPLKDKSNVYKHLQHHKSYMDWKKTIDKCKNKRVKFIDADTLLLIKCFFSSNVSHSSLENKY